MRYLLGDEMRPFQSAAPSGPRWGGWPCAVLYPSVGALLALIMPIGLLVLRSLAGRRWPDLDFLAAELTADPLGYVYLLLASAFALTVPAAMMGLQQDRLERLAITDALTCLPPRRDLAARLAEEVARAQRYGTPLALLMLDLDWLKRINDGHGHGAGDRALALVAATLLGTLRTSDLPARYAGDEFVALLPQTHAAEAMRLARRIGVQLRLRGEGLPGTPLSVSIGVADLDALATASAEALLAAADAALYVAKAQGRGQVVIYEPVQPLAGRVEAG